MASFRIRSRLIAVLGVEALVSVSILGFVIFPTDPPQRPAPEAAVRHWKRSRMLEKRVQNNLWRLPLNPKLQQDLLADADWHRRRSDRHCLIQNPDSPAETRADEVHARLDDDLDLTWAQFDGMVY